MQIKSMKATLVLNQEGQLGLFYGEDLEIEPDWVQLDTERGEFYVYDEESNCTGLLLEGMNQKTYERILDQQEILLIQVQDNDMTKPVKTKWVTLSISQQI